MCDMIQASQCCAFSTNGSSLVHGAFQFPQRKAFGTRLPLKGVKFKSVVDYLELC